MTHLIPENRWAAISAAIVANMKLCAIKEIQESAECSLRDALGIFYERYAKLRAEVPERFDRSNRDYWADFYTDGPGPPMTEECAAPDPESM